MIERFDGPNTLRGHDHYALHARVQRAKDVPSYCDPPYPGATRHKRWREKGYAQEMEDDDHRELARVLRDIQGMAVVSSYPSALYAELYAGWQVVTTQARINSLRTGAALKTECLYLSPRAVERGQQGMLF